MYNISKPTSITKQPSKVKVVEKDDKHIDDVLLVGFAQNKIQRDNENSWLGKAKKFAEKEEHISKKAVKIPEEDIQLQSNWLTKQKNEKYFELAVLHHLTSIIFIHGIGEGRLKTELRVLVQGKDGLSMHDDQVTRGKVGASLIEIQTSVARPF